MQSVTLDEKTISAALAGQVDLEPLIDNLKLPESNEGVKAVLIDEHGYIISNKLEIGDAVLVISLKSDGPLSSLASHTRREALGRILRCTMRILTGRSRSIPLTWRPYHHNNRLSFQADRLHRKADGGKTEAGRIVLESSALETGLCVFAFQLEKGKVNELDNLEPDVALLESALSNFSKALSQSPLVPQERLLGNDVSLDSSLPLGGYQHYNLDEWYNSRLTQAQHRFVALPLTGSARLVGPAGSGKTVALVVKCLKDLKNEIQKGYKRFLFITHASSTVDEIEKMILNMDPVDGYKYLASDKPYIQVTTLYALANDQMNYNLAQLTPISLDGHEGRLFQAEVLNEIIGDFVKGDWIAFKSGCKIPFIKYMECDTNSPDRRFFLWEVLNEFACVLDAEGVRTGIASREKYLTEKRKNWMMVLQTREEREVILRLYDRFRAWLRQAKAIGNDQMITDFLNHLDSFRWEATRGEEGFDVVFVDELHLFNRQERMVFRSLLRDPNKTPIVFMAYDAKQSPRDTFLNLPGTDSQKYDHWRDARLGKVEKVELLDVFRYTPEIAKVLSCIDQSFPGQDLEDEWPKYSGASSIKSGPIPTVYEFNSTKEVYSLVFQRALNLQKRLGRLHRVAVLCVSDDLFNHYLGLDFHRNDFSTITSRDIISSIPISAKKFLFSMPEFVAGLQFHTVLLIDVNNCEVPDGPYSAASLRKFVSQVYLGASRAECRLEFYSNKEHGGTSRILYSAIYSGAIQSLDRIQPIK